MKITKMIPMIAVKDIDKSLAFYTKKLGFKLVSPEDKVKEWKWFTVSRDEAELMVTQTESGHYLKEDVEDYFSSILYFYLDDVEKLYQEFTAKNLDLYPLETTFYGMKEFSLRDPDGHFLSFGQDI